MLRARAAPSLIPPGELRSWPAARRSPIHRRCRKARVPMCAAPRAPAPGRGRPAFGPRRIGALGASPSSAASIRRSKRSACASSCAASSPSSSAPPAPSRPCASRPNAAQRSMLVDVLRALPVQRRDQPRFAVSIQPRRSCSAGTLDRYGLMSRIGVPSSMSTPRTWSRGPSRRSNCTTVSPIGLGR